MPILDKILLYRIKHIDNLDYLFSIGKLSCPNHPDRDPYYIGIRDSSLIQHRSSKEIVMPPYGTSKDYLSFYFGNRSPMLYNIWKGFKDVVQRSQSNIIYLVSSYQLIKSSGHPYVFFDGHGYDSFSELFNNDEGLNHIDWDAVKSKQWSKPEEDPDLKRRKQAEFLVYRELSVKFLLGIGVFNKNAQQKILSILTKNDVILNCAIKPDWYY